MTARVVKYVRTQRGTMIHRDHCPSLRHATHAFPWHWADGRSIHEIALTALYHGYRACKHCQPFASYLDSEVLMTQ